MLKNPKPLFSLTMGMLGILLASITPITNAQTIASQVMANGGGQMNAGGNTLSYTLGQPIISLDYSTQPTSGYWGQQNFGNVILGVAENSIKASTCGNFDITIQVQAPDNQEVDSVSAYLNFDPTLLKVVRIKEATTLNLALIKKFDNAKGQIDFVAGTLNPVLPKGTFDLVTITFKARQKTNQTALVFNTDGARQTDVLLAANSVLFRADPVAFPIEELGILAGRVPNVTNGMLRIHVSPPTPEAFYQVTTDNRGKFSLENVAPGTYDVYVSASNSLQVKKSVTVTSCKAKTISFGKVKAGDVSGPVAPDNRVELIDFSVFSAFLNKRAIPQKDYNLSGAIDAIDRDPTFLNAHFDLNYDGVVAANDIGPIQQNFGAKGENKVGGPYLRRSARDSKIDVPSDFAIDESFKAIVSIDAGNNPIDAAEALMNFDPNRLQVNAIEVGSVFDTLLQSQFDNQTGQIHFAAGHLAETLPQGHIKLMTVHFTVIGKGGNLNLDTTTVAGGQTVDVVTEQVEFEESIVEPATCQLYGVQDQGLNNSQFFAINPEGYVVTPLGEIHEGYDIEAMDVHPKDNILYVASGNDTKNHPKGYLSQLDAETGQLIGVGPTGFNEISSLAFNPDGELWAWAKNDGLVQLDLTTGQGTLVLEYSEEVEDLSWNLDGTLLYGSMDTALYAYDPQTGDIALACDNLPQETEALEMLADGLMLLGMHKDKTLSLHAFDITTCQMVVSENIAIPYDDPEGLAMPIEACQR